MNTPSTIPTPEELRVKAAASLFDALSSACRDYAKAVRATLSEPGSPDNIEVTGVRQRQIIEIEGLAGRDGMKVAEISEAMGGYDVANTALTLRSLEKKGAVELVPGKTPQHWRLSEGFARRQRVWERDELILVLDRFVRTDGNLSQNDLEELVEELGAWALERGWRGRSVGSVTFKVENFRAIATDNAEGLPHVGVRDRQVYEELADMTDVLAIRAEQIRSSTAS
jgi:hypothetical protein